MITRILILALLFSLPSIEAIANTYTTSFPLTENPISESGNWIDGKAVGLDWANVATTPGLAIGTQSGTNANSFDDSAAILAGTWGSNQTVQATVYSTNQTETVFEELAVRLLSTVTAHTNTGYEILFRCLHSGGYVQIVRWNGPLGDFTYINDTPNSNYHGTQDGDVISGSISNNVIIGYVNGIAVIRGTDSTYTTGNPGMGVFLQGATGVNGDYGFTSFTATDGIDLPAPSILSVLVTNGQFTFSFQTVLGQSYTIQQNTNLATSSWGTATNVQGTGLACEFSTPLINTQPELFLRVREP